MSARPVRETGSRYLYEPFDAAAARIDAHERVTEERWHALERRLTGIERMLDRMERRMWLAVSGTAGFLAADVGFTILTKVN